MSLKRRRAAFLPVLCGLMGCGQGSALLDLQIPDLGSGWTQSAEIAASTIDYSVVDDTDCAEYFQLMDFIGQDDRIWAFSQPEDGKHILVRSRPQVADTSLPDLARSASVDCHRFLLDYEAYTVAFEVSECDADMVDLKAVQCSVIVAREAVSQEHMSSLVLVAASERSNDAVVRVLSNSPVEPSELVALASTMVRHLS